MGVGGIWQWVVVLIVILLLFGTKRLRNLGSDLGHAVKGFRKGMQSEPEKISEDGKGEEIEAEAADPVRTEEGAAADSKK